MLFFLVLTTILFLVYFYVGRRFISPSRLKRSNKRIAWMGLLISPLLIPLSFYLRLKTNLPGWVDILGWVAYVNLGFFSLVLAFLLLRDMIWMAVSGLNRAITLIRRNQIPHNPLTISFDPDRRYFLVQSMNMGIIGMSAVLSSYGLYEARRKATVVEIPISLPNLPLEFEGFRIAQISDIHVGPTIKRNYVQMITDQVNRIEADLIVFTGDLADGTVTRLRDDVSPLTELSAPFGKFFVTGNHEYYSGAEPWIEEIDRMGFTVLMNEHRRVQIGPAPITIAGVTDYHAHRFIKSQSSNPKGALEGTPPDTVKILLAHQPRSIFDASTEGYDLQLSGHTHGGQYFYGNLLVSLTQPFLRGLHRYNDTWIYINSGTGYWGPPLRLGVPSEISVILLTSSTDRTI